jgi:UPF0755 protein
VNDKARVQPISSGGKDLSKLTKLLAPIAVGVAVLGGGSSVWWNSITSAVSSDPEAKTVQFQVKQGAASSTIGKELESQGLIKSQLGWKLWTSFFAKGTVKAGTYSLAPNQNLAEVADRLLNAKVTLTSFTVKEGWKIGQMAEYFEKEKGWFKADDFIAATKKIPRDKFTWLPEGLPHLEGFLFPETYKISTDSATIDGVIEQMLRQFEQVALPEYMKNTDPNKLGLLKWVSLASIVEKEAVIAAERPLIAGVFTSRLNKNMRLESDPTVEYGLGIKQTADRPLTFAEVKRPNPYNTYMNAGIPPGPIAAPGIGALKAVLEPDRTEKLFFVAKYDGTHVFSKTLNEHVAATNAIRQQRNAQKKSGN